MEQKLTQKEVLDFFKKYQLKASDIMDITGYRKTQVYVWFDKELKETKMPWDIWLLLNALFNRKSKIITDILQKYDSNYIFEQSVEELRKNTREEIEEKMKALKVLKYFEEEEDFMLNDDRKELINKQHLARIMREHYNRNGTGIKIEEREAYKQIRDIENQLNIEKAITLQKLEDLNTIYEKNKDDSFIKKLLSIYDEYIKQLEDERLTDYLDNLHDEIQNRIDGGEPRKYITHTPEQEEEIKRLDKSKNAFDNFLKKKNTEEIDNI